jgi:N6-adenosine-specific RNA methylase IME4
MSAVAPVMDLSFARLSHLEERISESEHGGLRARWEFGHELLRARDGKGRLPNGYLVAVAEKTKASRAEIGKRMQFAARFASEKELCNAVTQFGSWHAIVNEALPAHAEVEPVGEMPPLPDGIYRTICADPPWQYGNTSTRGAAEDHYPTMSIEKLCALDVRAMAADEAHLYLWTTNGFLREAFGVMDAWGFEYKTTLVWAKPQIGMGNYFRSSTEYVLFGVRGGLRTVDCNQRNWFEAKRTRHSKKPARFFELVETASSGPYLEMFARERRLNPEWSYWGNEA